MKLPVWVGMEEGLVIIAVNFPGKTHANHLDVSPTRLLCFHISLFYYFNDKDYAFHKSSITFIIIIIIK